jgi:hypothetical protein
MMTAARKNRWHQFLLVPFLFSGFAAQASEYNAAHCQLVVNTLNFHWEKVAGPNTPCTGIEFTNGTFADAGDGQISMSGVSVSNASCIGTASYTLTLSADKTTLSGFDTKDNVPMTLTRAPGEDCFVGHWVLGGQDFVGHIAAAPFLSSFAVPSLSASGLLLLAALLAIAGNITLFRRRSKYVNERRGKH